MTRFHALGGRLKKYSILPWILLAGIALLAGARIFYITSYGPWVYSDSTAYITSGRNLAVGIGLGYPNPDGSFHDLTHYPPLYSLIIAGVNRLNLPELESLRWFNVVLVILSTFLLAGFFYQWGRSYWAGLGAAVWMLVSPAVLEAFGSAMSEPLFLFLEILGLILLAQYITRPQTGWLWAAGAVFGLAFLTRYIGLALVLAGGLSILLLSSGSWKKRLRAGLAFGGVALLPNGLWWLWVYSRSQTAAARVIDFSKIIAEGFSYVHQAGQVISEWLPYPQRLQGLIGTERMWLLAVGLLVFPLLIWTLNQFRKTKELSQQTRAGWLLVLFTGTYLLVLAGTFIFSRPAPDINQRMLVVIQPLVWGNVFLALDSAFRRLKWKWISALVVLTLAFFCFRWFNYASQLMVAELHVDGIGYASLYVRRWDILPELEKLPDQAILVSNEAPLVLYYTNQFPYQLGEELYDPAQTGAIGSGNGTADTVCRTRNAWVVLFRRDLHGGSLDDELYRQRVAGLEPVFEGESGGIYTCSGR